MKSTTLLAILPAMMLSFLFCGLSTGAAELSPVRGLTNDFFAMDTGVHGDGLKTPLERAKLLKQLGRR